MLKKIKILGYYKCIESEHPDFIENNYYPLLSTNNGLNIIGESQERIYLFQTFGDEQILEDNGKKVILI